MSHGVAISLVLFACGASWTIQCRADGASVISPNGLQATLVCSAPAGKFETIRLPLLPGPLQVTGYVRATRFRRETKWIPAVTVVVGNMKADPGVQAVYWSTYMELRLVQYKDAYLAKRRIPTTEERLPFRLEFDRNGRGTVQLGPLRSATTVKVEPERQLLLFCSSGDFVLEELQIDQ